MSDVKEKIQKLLALAGDAGAFDGEIENAMRHARRLMLQHNISENELKPAQDVHETAADFEYTHKECASSTTNLSNWESYLMSAITLLMGSVKSYSTHSTIAKRTEHGTMIFDDKTGQPVYGKKIVFVGTVQDVAEASELFNTWSQVIISMARMKYGGCFRGDGRAYSEGFTIALYNMAKSMNNEEKAQIAAPATDKQYALVLVKAHSLIAAKKDMAASYIRETLKVKLGSASRSGNRNDPNAFGAGKADGRNSGFSRKEKRLAICA